LKTPANTKSTTPKRENTRIAVLVIGLIVAAGLAWGGMALFNKSTANYAEEVAKPLEAALVQAGGKKICSRGDGGRGPDNTEPWYEANFAFAETESRTIEIVESVTSQNGYRLTHASPTNRGPLGVDDKFIDKWYFDNTSKDRPYDDLQAGKIDLAVQVNANGLESTCPEGITIDATHSAVGVDVRLPSMKR
jgi:hypothetical protein